MKHGAVENKRRAGKRAGGAALLLPLVLMPALGRSADITYALSHIQGTTWQYNYTVSHDAGDPPLWEIGIGFDPMLYREQSLGIVPPIPPADGWDEQVLASGLMLDAAYSAQSHAGGLAPGEMVTGLRVRFEWTGDGTPGDQPFWIFNSGDPVPAQQGVTTRADIAPIPVGGPWLPWALLIGLALLGALHPKRRRRVAGER